MTYYYIDLEAKHLEVEAYDSDCLAEDMEFFGVKNALELSDVDWRVFDSKEKADSWLKKYERTLNALDNKKLCQSRQLPAMIYRRRYIVQALLKEKLFTERHYLKKNWKPGDLFNFHDQTYFLTVRLTKITELKKDKFRYEYEIATPF